jgi:hypothetical protein
VYARTFWERTQKISGGSARHRGHVVFHDDVKCVLSKSKYPFLSNLCKHLDPVGCPEAGQVLFQFGSDDGKDVLVAEVGTIAKSLMRGFGKGVRLKKVVMDWVCTESGEWNIINVLSIGGALVNDRRVTKHDRDRVPEVRSERANTTYALEPPSRPLSPPPHPLQWIHNPHALFAGEAEAPKVLCEGDFCFYVEGEIPGGTGRKAEITPDTCKTVLGRSIIKAKMEKLRQQVDSKNLQVSPPRERAALRC